MVFGDGLIRKSAVLLLHIIVLLLPPPTASYLAAPCRWKFHQFHIPSTICIPMTPLISSTLCSYKLNALPVPTFTFLRQMVAMTSASQPKLSAAGCATVTGLAILANARIIRASNTIVLDVQLYLGPTDQDLLIGSLRYFNKKNSRFDDRPNMYIILATVNTHIIICLHIINSVFSSPDENPRPIYRFQAVDHCRITPLLVIYFR